MKRQFLTIIASILLTAGALPAQEPWDLRQCIDYALENNIQIQKQAVSTDYYGNELRQAKFNRLPGVNGNLNNSFSFGRTLQYDNTYAEYNSNQTGASLSANVLLSNGLTLSHSVKMANYNLKASLEDLQKAKDDVMLNVTAAYLQILFSDELVKVAQDQLAVTKLQIERTRKLVEAGSLAKGMKHSMHKKN